MQHFVVFPIPSRANRKPTCWSRIWWLARFAWWRHMNTLYYDHESALKSPLTRNRTPVLLISVRFMYTVCFFPSTVPEYRIIKKMKNKKIETAHTAVTWYMWCFMHRCLCRKTWCALSLNSIIKNYVFLMSSLHKTSKKCWWHIKTPDVSFVGCDRFEMQISTWYFEPICSLGFCLVFENQIRLTCIRGRKLNQNTFLFSIRKQTILLSYCVNFHK